MVFLDSITESNLDLGALLLCSSEIAKTLLAVLQSALLLANTKQLLNTLFQGRETNKVSDDSLYSTKTLVGYGIAVTRRRLAGATSGHVALVEASNDSCTSNRGGHPTNSFAERREKKKRVNLT